jgi:DHA2 family multidrug resistance protein
LGGSFGIAIIGTYLAVQMKTERANLVVNLYQGNPLLEQRLQAMTQGFQAKGFDVDTAHKMALAALDGSVMRQAAMLSYNACWMMILISFVITVPAIFLLRRPRKGPAAAVDAH